MRNNLLEIYKNCRGYYRWEQNPVPINFASKEAYNFIKKYFETSGKEKLFDLEFLEQYKENGKHIHTVSLFFLGLSFKEIIKEYIEKLQYETFSYIWFLVCLYHDIAFIEEDKIDSTNKYVNCLEYYLGKYNIKYDLFKHQWKENKSYKYSEYLVKNYFKYRLDKGKIDHGIISGYLLYDRLRKNYDIKYDNSNQQNYKDFNTDNFHWEIKHHDYYAKAAHIIIEHNIWLASDNSSRITYKKYGLNELIINQSNITKICHDKNPLLFYFGLLDSIEPTKIFSSNDSTNILEKIFIKFNNKCFSITFDKELIKNPKFEAYKNNIYGTKKWLNVEIQSFNKRCANGIKIFIN